MHNEKNNTGRISVDTGFLDGNEKQETTTASTVPQSQLKKSYNWRKIFLVGFVIVAFVFIIAAVDDSSTSYTSTSAAPRSTTGGSGSYAVTPTNNLVENEITVGDYRCSLYHAEQADRLTPQDSEISIESARSALDRKENEILSLERSIENSTVNSYSSEWQIDSYNDMVDRYNSLLASYDTSSDSFNRRVDKYNAEGDVYNSYLERNCTSLR